MIENFSYVIRKIFAFSSSLYLPAKIWERPLRQKRPFLDVVKSWQMNMIKEMEERMTDRTIRACTDCNQSATHMRPPSPTHKQTVRNVFIRVHNDSEIMRLCTVRRNRGTHHGACVVIRDALVPEIRSVLAIPHPPGL